MSEKRIQKTFAKLRANGKKALITFVTAGDPNLKKSKEIIFELEKSGADIIELGIVHASAQIKEIIAEGAYNMGDGEIPTVAKSRALLQAKRTALEQAGTYLARFSKIMARVWIKNCFYSNQLNMNKFSGR